MKTKLNSRVFALTCLLVSILSYAERPPGQYSHEQDKGKKQRKPPPDAFEACQKKPKIMHVK